MKKMMIFAACLALVSALSCKKEYTCVCSNIPYVGEKTVELEKTTKKKAKDACALYEEETYSSSLYADVTCEIK